MKLQESAEMYLETILVLKNKKGAVRSVDIVEKLGYSKSSVSRGVNLLKDGGYIVVDSDGMIEFTTLGKEKANSVYERHNILTTFLEKIGVEIEIADADACKIEHVISSDTIERIKLFIKDN